MTRMGEPYQPGGPGVSSTSLLDRVVELALDEDYADAAARRNHASAAPRRSLLWVAVALLGALLATAALQTQRSAPALATERASIVAEIQARSDHLQTLRRKTTQLTSQLRARQQRLLALAERHRLATSRIALLGGTAGTEEVSGPGVQVVVDDAAAADSPGGRTQVLDVDLQALVNGLWAARAEAVAINGHRLTTLSAIRGAGQAITVHNASLTPPYTVDALGNPDTLAARFLDTAGGQTWTDLKANLGLKFSMVTKDSLTLPADPGARSCCRHAETASR